MAIPTLEYDEQQKIVEMPITGDPNKRTPREQIIEEKPVVFGPKEAVFIIDWSRSNRDKVAPDSAITKVELLQAALPLVCRILGKDDSQAEKEAAAGKATSKGALGGVRSFAFNEPGRFRGWDPEENEFEDYRDLGDLNQANVVDALRLEHFDGRTFVMPALMAWQQAFDAEFPDGKDEDGNPVTAEVIIWTDGELNDEGDFESWLDAPNKRKMVIGVAVYGSGPGHDAAVAAYRRIAAKHDNISVVALTEVSDPNEVALDVQLMAC